MGSSSPSTGVCSPLSDSDDVDTQVSFSSHSDKAVAYRCPIPVFRKEPMNLYIVGQVFTDKIYL